MRILHKGRTKIRKGAFTLIELIMVVTIIGILASIGMSQLEGAIIKARLSEMYTTVGAIEKAENVFFLERGFYAATEDGRPGDDLPYSITQSDIDNFRTVLGLDIPGINSIFVYGVYYSPARIFVMVRKKTAWGYLCCKYITGNWVPASAHPWAKYLSG